MSISLVFTRRFYMMLLCVLLISIPVPGMCQEGAEPELVMPGDYNGDGEYSYIDVDILTESGVIGPRGYLPDIDTERFDINLDGLVTMEDIFWVVSLIPLPDDVTPGIAPQNCVPGDITFDGLVDTLDMNHLEVCYEFAMIIPHIWIFKYSHSDADGSGSIGIGDFNILCANWSPGGEACPDMPPWMQ